MQLCCLFLKLRLIFRCDHEKRKSAVDCITEIIGENNPEHFFVATQDADMRKKFQEVCAFVFLSIMLFNDITCKIHVENCTGTAIYVMLNSVQPILCLQIDA